MTIKVFVECEAGLDKKNVFNEETLEHEESFTVSRKYPFPYGFIQGTKSGDGDCLDCFIVTKRPFTVGDIIEAEVVGMMEQFETRGNVRKEDHNVLVIPVGESVETDEELKQTLRDFVSHVWDHRVGKKIEIGNFYSKEVAEKLIKKLKIK